MQNALALVLGKMKFLVVVDDDDDDDVGICGCF